MRRVSSSSKCKCSLNKITGARARQKVGVIFSSNVIPIDGKHFALTKISQVMQVLLGVGFSKPGYVRQILIETKTQTVSGNGNGLERLK